MSKTGPRLPIGPSQEQETVRAILQFLHLHHILAWRMNTGAMAGQHKGKRWFLRFGVTGMSDIIGVWKAYQFQTVGQFLAIEVKSATGKVRPAQQEFMDQVEAAGGKAFVARNLDDVKRELGL